MQQKKIVHSEKVASIGVLSAGVAHNINTPLGVISLSCSSIEDAMGENPIDEQIALESLDEINLTVERISNIIKALRSYSVDININDTSSINIKDFFNKFLAEFGKANRLD